MTDEWGPWIEHGGLGCPVPFGTIAEVTEKAVEDGSDFCAGDERTGVVLVTGAMIEPWVWGNSIANIIRYRVRKPRGLTILADIAAGVRQPERVDE
jgi:hypothetical protein